MSASKIIKQLLIEREMSVKDLADKLEVLPQSMSNKLYRDSLSFSEMVKIANLLNCDVKVITRDSAKEFMQ